MLADIMPAGVPSLLICGSLIPNPDDVYLSRLRSSLIHSPSLADLREGVAELPDLWSLLVAKEPALHRVNAGPLLQSFADWLTGGVPCGLSLTGRTPRNTLLAVLTVLAHLLEYVSYLESCESNEPGRQDAHARNLDGLRDGGIQGLCVGLLSAVALACSKSKAEVAKHGAVALRLALCVGAFVDLDEMELQDSTVSLSARWSRGEGDGSIQAVLDHHPQAYIGVRIDACSATMTVPRGSAEPLARHLEEAGAVTKRIDLQGRFHHKGHYGAFRRLADLCASSPLLRFPQQSRPLVPLRRNDGGQVVTDEVPLHEMALQCILVEQADWHATMTKSVAAMARAAGEGKPRVLVLGPADCMPRSALALATGQVVRPWPSDGLHNGYPDDSIAVIGASCRFPRSETPQEFWNTIRDGQRGSSLPSGGAFDCAFFRKSPREAEYMDPQHRLVLHLAYEALESGGHFGPSSSSTDNIGCYLGMSSCDYEENVNSQAPTAFSFTGTARAFASGRISHFFGLTGPSMLVDTACSSSAVAIHTACKAIQAGECSLALAGGVNLTTAQAPSHRNLAAASFLSPSGYCRPFDAGADGYCRGEGGGFVLLKKLSAAVADNDCVLGVLAASAVNNSKGGRSITLPTSESQSQLYRYVLKKAALSPLQVSYVEAHGTGTTKGDPVEARSIRQVFGERHRAVSTPLRLGSVKGNIGHSEAASGLAAVSKVLLMLQHRLIPPHASFSALNPAIAPLEEANMEIPTRLQPWREPFHAALVNNYGASGTNAAMVVCQAPPAPSRRILSAGNPARWPFIIAAHSASSLRRYCRELLQLIEAGSGAFGDALSPSVGFCLAQRQNQSLCHRVLFSASSTDELKSKLASQLHDDQFGSQRAHGSPKPVVLVFAGQTGRRVRLSRAAYVDSVLLQRHLDRCDRTLQTLGLRSLFPRIFDAEPVDDLVDLHCMLFSLQYSVASSWIDAGLEIAAIVGHSLGQLVALCVSGVLGLRDALKMISGRASLIQSRWGLERGTMLSVDASAATVRAISESLPRGLGVEIACYNSSTHHVVVGTEAAVAAFEDAARSGDVQVKRLAVTHGFHSEMVDCIIQDYSKLVQSLVLHRPRFSIEPCSKSAGSWDTITPELIARQSREPVYFADAVSRVEERLGPCVWLEAGSGSAGVVMARRALAGRLAPDDSLHSFHSVRLDGPDPITSLADSTLGLWREGVRVQFWLYHPSQRCCFVPLELPPYQFEQSQHHLSIPEKVQNSEQNGDSPKHLTQEAPELVSLKRGEQKLDADAVEFSINQQSEEYATYVRGRTVFGHILAPASVYMESAARAFSLLPNHAQPSNASPLCIGVADVKLHAPFGLNLQRRLRLTLRKKTSLIWHFVVESYACGEDIDQDFSLQASGTVGWQGQDRAYLGPQRPLLRRLYDRCEQLCNDRSASVVQGGFVKKILGRVASYDDSYFGIRSINSKALDAVGNVAVPVVSSQCRAATLFSPPAFDNFLLVAELHASSLGDLADDQSYICSGFDAVIPQACPTSDSQGPWTVLSSLDRGDNKTLVCDIFVFAAGLKTLSLVILGAKFVPISLTSLQKVLDGLHGVRRRGEGSASSILDEAFPSGTPASSTASKYPIDYALDGRNTKRSLQNATVDVFTNVNSGLMRQSPRCASLTSMSQLTPTDDGKDVDFFSPSSEPFSETMSSDTSEKKQTVALLNLLRDHLDCSQEFSSSTPLGAIGLDSLVAIQLQSDIEKAFGKGAGPMNLDENSTFSDLCDMVFPRSPVVQTDSIPLPVSTAESMSTSKDLPHYSLSPSCVVPEIDNTETSAKPDAITRAVLEFQHVKRDTNFAQKTGFAGFFSSVYQKQMSVVLAYILEAFSVLGCDLSILSEGDPLPLVSYLPKHDKLVSRLHEMLEHAGLITRADCQSPYFRTGNPVAQARPAADLHPDLLNEFPLYRPDHELLNVTGSRLADCLAGRADPLQLLFQDEASIQLLEDVYVSSPMFATGNQMLGDLVRRFVSHSQCQLRILEIGAGTGATTQLVLDTLFAANADFIYTFTDVSVALIAGARKKLQARYGAQKMQRHIEFAPLDIEQSPPASMKHSYDFIISSNCIHATRNLQQSCANIETLLRRDGGMLCLLELTRPLGWLDCVFGLLSGWWRFHDGRRYALMGEHEWAATLRGVGLHNVDWTDDGTEESQQFRLITAWR